MTQEFDYVRSAFRASLPARVLIRVGDMARSAWRSSFFNALVTNVGGAFHTMPAPQRIEIAAIAAAVAAGLQPLLMRMMPQTVRPAMPVAVFIGVVLIAGLVAWQAVALARFLAPDRPPANEG